MANANGTTAPGNGAGNGTASPLLTEYTDSITVPVVNRTGAEVGTVTIDPKDFGGKISKQLMHEAVLMYRANQRAGHCRTHYRRGRPADGQCHDRCRDGQRAGRCLAGLIPGLGRLDARRGGRGATGHPLCRSGAAPAQTAHPPTGVPTSSFSLN